MSRSIPSDRIRSIDSLRAIAALIVLYAHAWPAVMETGGFWGAGFFEFVRDAVFQRGQLGVTLFFVISGYVIPLSLIDHASGNLRKFAVARFMRLYPAYWLSAGVFVLLLGMPDDTRTLWFNLTMVQRLFAVPDLIGIYWTLFIELLFYSLMALLFAIGWLAPGQKAGRVVVGLVGLTVAAAAARRWTDLPLPAGTMMFLCLMFFGTWLRIGTYDGRKLLVATAAFLASLLAAAWLLYYPENFGAPWYLHYGRYFLAVTLFLLGTRVIRLEARWLAWLGLISYSVYLLHQPIIAFVVEQLGVATSLGARLGTFGLIVAATLIAAAIVYHVVERPFIVLGKTINRAFETDAAPDASLKMKRAL